MKWDFTPEDVRNGKADYTVAEFKKDLLEEIQLNLAKDRGDEQTIQFYSFLTIMLCTSMAFGKSIDSFVTSTKKYFPSEALQNFLTGNKALLEDIRGNNKENIEMLCAVVHRRIQDDVDKGVSKDNIAKTITAELLEF
jgi:hypothetical protein